MNESSRDPFEQSNLDDQSMSVLLQQARDGNREARGTLMAQIQHYLAFVAHHQLEKKFQAKMGPSDVVQQSMLQAVENLAKFQGNTLDEFRAWIRTILINEARQMKRDFRAQKRDVVREQRLAANQSHGVQIDVTDGMPTPGTNANTREQSQAVEVALARLPEQDRQIIQWRNWDGLPFEEIAARLKISASSASRRWYAALVEFKKQFEDDHE